MTEAQIAKFDLVVIGGGPAGVSGALAAGILGKKVALIEKEAVVGGAGINTARDCVGAFGRTVASAFWRGFIAATRGNYLRLHVP